MISKYIKIYENNSLINNNIYTNNLLINNNIYTNNSLIKIIFIQIIHFLNIKIYLIIFLI